jgi:hypothetical protein
MTASVWTPAVPSIIVDPALRTDLAAAAAAATAGATLVTTILPSVGAVALNLQKYLVEGNRYSAFGFIDPSKHAGIRAGTDNATYETQLQKWLDAMKADNHGGFLPNGTFLLGAVNYYLDGGAPFGITSLKLPDNTDIEGESQRAILKAVNGMYGAGAFYRLLSSRDATRLKYARLHNFSVDGNKANQTASTQCSNIVLEVDQDVSVSYLRSINANGNAIMLRGAVGGVAGHITVDHCLVQNAATIGIQMSHVTGGRITNNGVSTTGDNCIDFYGEDGTTTADDPAMVISGNALYSSSLVGIFVETSSHANIFGNVINLCPFGINVNRINGQPRAVNISNNITRACNTGSRVTGDTGGVAIKDNIFDGFSVAGVQLGAGAAGNTSYVDVSNNTFIPATNTVACISIQGGVASYNTGRNNTVISAGITEAYLLNNTALTSVVNNIGGFKVIPGQVGPDSFSLKAKVVDLQLLNGSVNNLAANFTTVTIPDNTSGTVQITGYQGGVGRSRRLVPYMKYGGTLVLGTQVVDPVVTATPTNACTVVANQLQINFVAGANNYAQWGLQETPQD